MVRKTLLILGFAVVHAVLTVVVIMLDMGAAMSGFEPDTTPVSPAHGAFLDGLLRVLLFPLTQLAMRAGVPHGLDYLVLFLNGLLWSVVCVIGWTALGHAMERSR